MFMPVTVIPPEDGLFDPDDLKMPESPDHRRTIDAIGLAATTALGDDYQIFRDMNWYPDDGGNAMAPDVMVLPAGAFVAPPDLGDKRLKSYQQHKTGGPVPTVVVEVPSDTDTFVDLRAKVDRYCELGVVVYVVVIDQPMFVDRVTPEHRLPVNWSGKAMPELGGISVDFVNGEPMVTTPDGMRGNSDRELLEQVTSQARSAEQRANSAEQRATEAEQRANSAEQRATEAEQRANSAEQRATEAEQRAAELGARLSELRVDPETS